MRNRIDFLRFALASAVIVSHAWPIAFGLGAHDPLEAHGLPSLGSIAVDAFFVLSGFLITSSWMRSPELWPFLVRRARRIYPAFLVLSVLTAFVLAPLLAEPPVHPYSGRQLALIGADALDLVGYGFPYGGLYNVLSSAPVPHELNGSLWTIRYEALCYLGLAGLGIAGALKRRWALVGLFAIAYVAYVVEPPMQWHRAFTALLGAPGAWPRFATFFLAGAIARVYDLRPKRGVALACLGVLAVGVVWPRLFQMALPVCGGYALLFAAFAPGPLTNWGRYGDFSYGMYLYGWPLEQLVELATGTKNPLVLMGLTWPLAVLAGIASWYAVEERFLKGRRAAVGATAAAVVS